MLSSKIKSNRYKKSSLKSSSSQLSTSTRASAAKAKPAVIKKPTKSRKSKTTTATTEVPNNINDHLTIHTQPQSQISIPITTTQTTTPISIHQQQQQYNNTSTIESENNKIINYEQEYKNLLHNYQNALQQLHTATTFNINNINNNNPQSIITNGESINNQFNIKNELISTNNELSSIKTELTSTKNQFTTLQSKFDELSIQFSQLTTTSSTSLATITPTNQSITQLDTSTLYTIEGLDLLSKLKVVKNHTEDLRQELQNIFNANIAAIPNKKTRYFYHFEFENIKGIKFTCENHKINDWVDLFHFVQSHKFSHYLGNHDHSYERNLYISSKAVLNGEWIKIRGNNAILESPVLKFGSLISPASAVPYTPCESACGGCKGKDVSPDVQRYLIKFKWD